VLLAAPLAAAALTAGAAVAAGASLLTLSGVSAASEHVRLAAPAVNPTKHSLKGVNVAAALLSAMQPGKVAST
jgi:hypothetical protein